jgi:hypothetical protein
MSNHNVLSGKRLKRVAVLVPALLTVLVIAACGGSGTPTTASGVQNAAFISNTYSGNLQIVDTQNDTTAYTQSNYELGRAGCGGSAGDCYRLHHGDLRGGEP